MRLWIVRIEGSNDVQCLHHNCKYHPQLIVLVLSSWQALVVIVQLDCRHTKACEEWPQHTCVSCVMCFEPRCPYWGKGGEFKFVPLISKKFQVCFPRKQENTGYLLFVHMEGGILSLQTDPPSLSTTSCNLCCRQFSLSTCRACSCSHSSRH